MAKKDQKEKTPRKKLTKVGLVLAITIPAICLVAGGVGGVFLAKLLIADKPAIDYSKMNETNYEDDMDALMNKYKATNTNDYTTSFKSYEIANIGVEKFKEHKYVISKTHGLVKAMGVDQTVRASSIKDDNEYFMENISCGMLSTAKRFYQKDNQITTYNGNDVQTEAAKWDESSAASLSLEEHEEKWGKQLSRPLIYIISSKTTLETSTATKTNDGYEISLDLNPKTSVLRYVRQMISISGIQDPRFHTVNLNLKLDANLNLLSMKIHETYSVVMVATAESDATLDESYIYDNRQAIPDLNTNINYTEGE